MSRPTREELILDALYEIGESGGRYTLESSKDRLNRMWESSKRELLSSFRPTFAIKDVEFSQEIGLDPPYASDSLWIYEPSELIQWLLPLPTRFSQYEGKKILLVFPNSRYIYDCHDYNSFPEVFVRAVTYNFCYKQAPNNKIDYFNQKALQSREELARYVSLESAPVVLR